MLNFAKYSTALTVVAATGFLIGAILTDNGSELTANINYDAKTSGKDIVLNRVDVKNGFNVAELLKTMKMESGDQIQPANMPDDSEIDRIITASVERVQREESQLSAEQQQGIRSRIDQATFSKSMKNKAAPASGSMVVVQAGDTLYRIGLNHGLTISKIAAMNDLSEPYTVKVGQKLRVN